MILCLKKICKDRNRWEYWLYSIPICIFFISPAVYSQVQYPKMKVKYGQLVEVKMNAPVIFEDSLTLTLTSFSHKHAMTGGPTKATVYVTIVKGNLSDEIMLSVHGTEGKVKKGQVVFDEYDTIVWNSYKIVLRDFSYEESIAVLITKE